MQKRSSKLESTRKTEQHRFGWKFLTMVKVNGQRSRSTVNGWRGSVTSPRADVAGRESSSKHVWRVSARDWRVWARKARGRYKRRVEARGSACSWGRNFRRRVEARVMQFLAVLGWVLLGIGRSVFLCLLFGSWMHRTLISECCRYCGHDGGGLLLTVTPDEGEGSGRTPEISTGTRKSEEWLWYHVNNIKWERKTE